MRAERGSTLMVVMVMLVVITLLGIASIRMSDSSLRVVGNMQSRKAADNLGLRAIEVTVDTVAPFTSPTAAVAFTAPAGYTVSIGNRSCTQSSPASGYSALSNIAPEDNTWEFVVTVTDAFTGAATRMTQGVRVRQLAGNCL